MTLIEQLIIHEGLKLKPYLCPAGKLTIGVGRNLDDMGITKYEAMMLLENDVARLRFELMSCGWFNSLDQVRQDAILNMAFNLGVSRLLRFEKMIAALRSEDYPLAASEMLSSTWSAQVGKRAVELAQIIKTGIAP